MDNKVLQQTITAAESELEEVKRLLAELAPLAAKRNTLEQLITHAKSLLSDSPAEGQSQPPSTGEPKAKPSDENPVWKGVQDVLMKVGRPMKVPDITQALLDSGWKLSDKWARETVRAAIKRHPNIFDKAGSGRFTLKKRTDVGVHNAG